MKFYWYEFKDGHKVHTPGMNGRDLAINLLRHGRLVAIRDEDVGRTKRE